MESFFILNRRVLGFNPSCSAAFSFPLTRHPHCSSTVMIWLRSTSSRLLAAGSTGRWGRTIPRESSTLRVAPRDRHFQKGGEVELPGQGRCGPFYAGDVQDSRRVLRGGFRGMAGEGRPDDEVGLGESGAKGGSCLTQKGRGGYLSPSAF